MTDESIPYTVEITLKGQSFYARSPEEALEQAKWLWLSNKHLDRIVEFSVKRDDVD